MSFPTKTLPEPFSKDYYSTRNYKDYLTRKFDALARDIDSLIQTGTSLLDFGCGYGGLLDALYRLGYENINGTDISQWAIEEGKRRFPHLKEQLQYYNRNLLTQPNRVLLMLDVLEHMPEYEIESVLKLARSGCMGSLIVRIPVCANEGEPFVLPVSNNDPTHISCHAKDWWNERMEVAGFKCRSFIGMDAIYDSPGVLSAVYS